MNIQVNIEGHYLFISIYFGHSLKKIIKNTFIIQ